VHRGDAEGSGSARKQEGTAAIRGTADQTLGAILLGLTPVHDPDRTLGADAAALQWQRSIQPEIKLRASPQGDPKATWSLAENAARLESPSAVVDTKMRLPVRARLERDGRDQVRSVSWPFLLRINLVPD
jgi:hypothetical protein